ncbi:MAG TPA: hypothetical protein VGP09_21195 [Caballeronia sp.]|jgi:hypothetical protein|nr:hypothetical protein [Caballeronia sp.]
MNDIVHAPIREIRPDGSVSRSARGIWPHEKSAESAWAHRPIGRVGSARRLRDNTVSMNASSAVETAFSSGNARFPAL